MKEISMIDWHESQREYIKAIENGYGYTRHGNFAHYFFRRDQIEPVIRAKLPPGDHFIWTFRGCTLTSATEGTKAVVTPCTAPSDWTSQAHRIAAELNNE